MANLKIINDVKELADDIIRLEQHQEETFRNLPENERNVKCSFCYGHGTRLRAFNKATTSIHVGMCRHCNGTGERKHS